MPDRKSVHILIADDDPDDCMLARAAFRESRIANEVRFVHNGEELMNYLLGLPPFTDRQRYPLPGLVLLDLNMPLKDGREALTEIKSNPQLRGIPVVILTTSADEEDILRSYDDGVNSFITKPVSFSGLLEVVQSLGRYWLDIVELPAEHLKP
jgi:CheY-like chemotaxis protein